MRLKRLRLRSIFQRVHKGLGLLDRTGQALAHRLQGGEGGPMRRRVLPPGTERKANPTLRRQLVLGGTSHSPHIAVTSHDVRDPTFLSSHR